MALVSDYRALIEGIVAAAGASHAIMHVHVGLGLYLLAQLLVGDRRGSMTALNAVFAAEVLNEVMNRLAYGTWRWDDTLSDVALTMFWPAAITLVSQYRRARWGRLYERRLALRAAQLARTTA